MGILGKLALRHNLGRALHCCKNKAKQMKQNQIFKISASIITGLHHSRKPQISPIAAAAAVHPVCLVLLPA